jgi:PiT family inorganic phosphate transporter
VIKVVAFIFVSPLLGFTLGSLMMVLVAWVCRRTSPLKVDRWFRRLQLVSAGPIHWAMAATTRRRPSASSGCC